MSQLTIHDPIDELDFLRIVPGPEFSSRGVVAYIVATEHKSSGELQEANIRLSRESATKLRDFLNDLLAR